MSKASAQIPVIDISSSNPHAATQLLDAAANNGFVFVENNDAAGMPPAKIDNMFDLSKDFFQGPIENKQECPTQNNRGWVSMQQETLDPGNQKRGDFKEYNTPISYPAHSDYGTLTLLFQLPGQPGLEILTPSKTWESVPIKPQSDTSKTLPILVNIGDLLAYWTNGLLKSTVHRVIFPKEARRGGEDRYSMAYFCHPLDEAELVAVPSKRVEEYKGGVEGVNKGGKTLTAKDHLLERLAATYGTKA
ncbi:hypothetical protein E4T47_01397 [Aureobasidium subglaciale]|nr:hypothetical protein E4T47_01397 [Aureobasidium subglaciale]